MQKITPFLWFADEAEEAARFYVSVFKKSKLGKILKYDEESSKGSGRPMGSVLTVDFKIEGQEFTALNGGPMFKFTEAISFVINCKTQKEVDIYWEKLTADGGQESQCGWLKDKYGVSWQIVPIDCNKYIFGKNREGAKRAMAAMFEMKKLDINKFKEAYQGGKKSKK